MALNEIIYYQARIYTTYLLSVRDHIYWEYPLFFILITYRIKTSAKITIIAIGLVIFIRQFNNLYLNSINKPDVPVLFITVQYLLTYHKILPSNLY